MKQRFVHRFNQITDPPQNILLAQNLKRELVTRIKNPIDFSNASLKTQGIAETVNKWLTDVSDC